jgi:hypothetical protein
MQDGKLRGFAMGQAISVRTDYTAGEVRVLPSERKMRRRRDGCKRLQPCSTAPHGKRRPWIFLQRLL